MTETNRRDEFDQQERENRITNEVNELRNDIASLTAGLDTRLVELHRRVARAERGAIAETRFHNHQREYMDGRVYNQQYGRVRGTLFH